MLKSIQGLRKNILAVLLCIAWLALPVLMASAQNRFTRICGSDNNSLPLPKYIAANARKDPEALFILSKYLKASKVIGEWKGLRASGEFTDNLGNSDNAELTILSSNQFRLDVTTSEGQRSIRILGSSGLTREANGNEDFIPQAIAESGLLIFPQLFSRAYLASGISVLNQGSITVEGENLNRITLEEPIGSNSNNHMINNINVIDLYFSPLTSLLVKSVMLTRLNTSDSEKYLIVTSYESYKQIQGEILPTRYQQNVNGHSQWTLQLSSINLDPDVSTSYFQF